MSELKFSSEEEAIQYLADVSGKKIRVAGFNNKEVMLKELGYDSEEELNADYASSGESIEEIYLRSMGGDVSGVIDEGGLEKLLNLLGEVNHIANNLASELFLKDIAKVKSKIEAGGDSVLAQYFENKAKELVVSLRGLEDYSGDKMDEYEALMEELSNKFNY
jgi:hypothetical protein